MSRQSKVMSVVAVTGRERERERWEEEQGSSLRTAVRESLGSHPRHVTLLIGPVGGLSGAEADAAKAAGVVVVGAGARILRAETAPVVALAALMYEAGELGG